MKEKKLLITDDNPRLDAEADPSWFEKMKERCSKSEMEISEWLDGIEASLPPVPTDRRRQVNTHPWGSH
jgi:hypothetical protein